MVKKSRRMRRNCRVQCAWTSMFISSFRDCFDLFVIDFYKSGRDIMSGQLLLSLFCHAKVTISPVKLSFINFNILLLCFRKFALVQSCDVLYASINSERLKMHFNFLYVLMYYMIYLLTTIELTHGGSSTVHIYTQTIHRTTQWNRIHKTEHM